MTAFSRAERAGESLKAKVEIRAYNSRHLDVVLRASGELLATEDRIKALAAQRVGRGRVEIKLLVDEFQGEAGAFEVDWDRARSYYRVLRTLREAFELSGEVPLGLLAQMGGVITPADTERDREAEWQIVKACLEEALDDLDRMRCREGDYLAADLAQRLERITDGSARIAEHAEGLPRLYYQRLKERVSALCEGSVNLAPERIAQEAALLADRSDITEELVRIRSHVEQFRRYMNAADPAGRKLNFLLQEFNREFNTIGSKAADSTIAHIVVEMKSELEKMREQVQNIE